ASADPAARPPRRRTQVRSSSSTDHRWSPGGRTRYRPCAACWRRASLPPPGRLVNCRVLPCEPAITGMLGAAAWLEWTDPWLSVILDLELMATVLEPNKLAIETNQLLELVERDVFGLHVAPQHRWRWLHTRHRQSSGSSKARGSNSPARVASIMLTARSLQNCARSALNGTRKCSHSQVSAFVTVNSAGLVISRYG